MIERWQQILIVIGISLATVAITADTIGISSPGFSNGQMILLGFGCILIVFGVLGRRTPQLYQSISILLMNFVVLLFVIEFLFGFYSWVTSDDDFAEPPPDSRATLDYYIEQDWGISYWEEFRASRQLKYTPYVVWRRAPYQGELVNIDAQSLRVTPQNQCDADAFTVFVMGGSTIWGTGAPDWGTIPAYLQQQYNDNSEQPVCVINMGETAFVSEQSVIQLEQALKSGWIPDAVIFYDGANDVFAAYQSNQAGTHQNIESIAANFEQRTDDTSTASSVLNWIEANTYTGVYIQRLRNSTVPESDESVNLSLTDDDIIRLADEIVQHYDQQIDWVQNLASVYDFSTLFVWQPVLPTDAKSLTAQEQEMFNGVAPDLVALYAATYAQMERHPNILYLANVFTDVDEFLWIDFLHVTPEANLIISDAIFEALPSDARP